MDGLELLRVLVANGIGMRLLLVRDRLDRSGERRGSRERSGGRPRHGGGRACGRRRGLLGEVSGVDSWTGGGRTGITVFDPG